MKTVWVLQLFDSDYSSTIYGIFTTRKLAYKALKSMQDVMPHKADRFLLDELRVNAILGD